MQTKLNAKKNNIKQHLDQSLEQRSLKKTMESR